MPFRPFAAAYRPATLGLAICLPIFVAPLVLFSTPPAGLIVFFTPIAGYFFIRSGLKRKTVWAVGGRRII